MRDLTDKCILVTGGAGFIGSNLVRYLIRETNASVINLDKLTYAGHLESLSEIGQSPRHLFKKADICDWKEVNGLLAEYRPAAIMHLAAESHVDRSIDSPAGFIETNIIGTYTLLEAALKYWRTLDGPARDNFIFHHISTDEVYGSLGKEGLFTESSPYQPNSPYSASKASSDHLVRAWHHTYGFPAVITNCSNNYGPYQYPEKLIPMVILNAVEGKPIPIYGKGDNVRDWLYVEDHVRALIRVVTRGAIGETYNIGGHNEMTNVGLVHLLCGLLDKMVPGSKFAPHASLIASVEDRPGHDKRYAIDAAKIQTELEWTPAETPSTGLEKTVRWYLGNRAWCAQVMKGRYHQERLGLGRMV